MPESMRAAVQLAALDLDAADGSHQALPDGSISVVAITSDGGSLNHSVSVATAMSTVTLPEGSTLPAGFISLSEVSMDMAVAAVSCDEPSPTGGPDAGAGGGDGTSPPGPPDQRADLVSDVHSWALSDATSGAPLELPAGVILEWNASIAGFDMGPSNESCVMPSLFAPASTRECIAGCCVGGACQCRPGYFGKWCEYEMRCAHAASGSTPIRDLDACSTDVTNFEAVDG
eukprot:5261885-Prymnesium_polylepis.1